MTPKNYTELQQLHDKYNTAAGGTGLDIIGFPCNQFGNQEPKSNAEIADFVAQYGVKFKIMDKIKVNGSNANPLYKFLKKKLPGAFGNFVKWNFTKFLITREGLPYKRYAPNVSPLAFEDDIKALLEGECDSCDAVVTDPVADTTQAVDAGQVVEVADGCDSAHGCEVDWEERCEELLGQLESAKFELESERFKRAAAEVERDVAVQQLEEQLLSTMDLPPPTLVPRVGGGGGGGDGC